MPFFATLGANASRSSGLLLPPPGYSYFERISTDTNNYNVRTRTLTAGWNGTTFINATIIIDSGVVIGSNSTVTPSFDTDILPNYSAVTLINNGRILGKGGNGGAGAANAGSAGGLAINFRCSGLILNNSTIGGGGGGGGGGANSLLSGSSYVGGSGGGGGSGQIPGVGGAGASGSLIMGNTGDSGTTVLGGNGGASQGTDQLPTTNYTFNGARTSNGGTPQGQTVASWTPPTGGISRVRVRMWGGGGGGAWWPGGICIGGDGAGGAQFDLTNPTQWNSGLYVECGNSGLSGYYGGSGGGGFPDSYRSGGAGGFSRIRSGGSGGTILGTVHGGNGGRNTFNANPNRVNSFDAGVTNLNESLGGVQGNYSNGGDSTWGGGGGVCSSYSGGIAGNSGGNGGSGNTDGNIPGGGGGSCDSCGPQGNGGYGRIIITVNP